MDTSTDHDDVEEPPDGVTTTSAESEKHLDSGSTPRTPRIRRILAALLTAGAVAGSGAWGLEGVASASPTTTIEHFDLVFTTASGPGYIRASGDAFTAGGVDYRSGTTGLAVFDNGAFTFFHSNFTYPTPTVDNQTCVVHQPGTADYKLGRGYGAYQHISGTGTADFMSIVTYPRNGKGACAFDANPTSVLTSGTASGPVTFK